MKNTKVTIRKDIALANDSPFVLISGPCVIESEAHALKMAAALKDITQKLKIPFIFKSSFDKANRSSVDSYRGPGLKEGLEILRKVSESLDVPVITDIHNEAQAEYAKDFVDIIQIPAFLSRQTDLIKAAAQTQKPINIKKGQFLAPQDMEQVIKKARRFGNEKIILTERGSSFGYHNLVVDFRGLEIMKGFGYPIVFDATHSVQLPGGSGDKSGGDRNFVSPLSKAAAAVGIAGLFLETHDKPDEALSDGPNSVVLDDMPKLLEAIKKIDEAVK